jgi:hypothetical protein
MFYHEHDRGSGGGIVGMRATATNGSTDLFAARAAAALE